jgi:hypothetical protein
MPAVSQQQQKLFGLALAVKRGEVTRSEASDEVLNIVDSMSEKDIEDFASTSHEGLPKQVEARLRETLRELMRETAIQEADPCWKGYQQIGMKKKNGKEVPNCVPESVNEAVDIKDGKYRFYSKDGVGYLTYGGKELASGDFDWEDGSNSYWMSHSSFKGSQKAFDTGKDVINYFKSKKITTESVNEVASRTAMEIGGLTGMNKDAIQKFVDEHNLDIEKVFQFVKKGKLPARMDFMTAVVGKPGNPIQKKMIKMFGESVNESSYNLGNQEYTNRKLTPTQILDLAMAYANVPGKGNPMYNNKMEKMIKVANDLAKLTGTKQMDAKSRGKEPALILFLLKNGLVTQDEYVKLYKNLLQKHIAVSNALKNADPASRMIGGAAARQAHKDMKGEFEESVKEGKKRFNQKNNVGSSKYVISYHDGQKKHKDGSDFFDIQIFKNQKDLETFKKALLSKGFIEESVVNEAVSKTYKLPTQRGTLHIEVEEDPAGVFVDVIFNKVDLTTTDIQFPTGEIKITQRQKRVKLKESVNELKKLPNGNFSIKKGYNTFADYEKNAKAGDTILKYDKRGGMIKTFVNGSELHQNAKKYLSKVHSIVGDKVNLSLFGKQGYATVPDYEKKEVGVLVLESNCGCGCGGATIGGCNTSIVEDFKAVVGKTVFSDGKGKAFFGYYKEDDSAYFVDYKTWAKLGMKDVSKGDTNKNKVLAAILRNQKQFNKKVDYNMWHKKTNPTFEQSMDYFIKNGFISNITKAGIKVD